MRKRLALFFTRGVSLQDWLDRGMFAREKRTYEEMLTRGHVDSIVWVTYGSADEGLAARLRAGGMLHPAIEVLPMPSRFRSKWGLILYSLCAPIVHRRALREAFLFKSNQMDGAWTALLAKILFKAPFFLRTGFTLSHFERLGAPEKRWRIRFFATIERVLYRFADMASVSSRQDFAYVSARFSVKKLSLLRNYVDTAVFSAADRKPEARSIAFVGRLHAQKNLAEFIRGLAGSGRTLHLYGDGPDREYLERLARECDVAAVFHGAVPNGELPERLARAEVFALPSLFEGMPKALLEAMACGCLCIGADVPGVNEVITDGVNGLLAKSPTAEGFRALIARLDSVDMEAITQNGICHIRESYSLAVIVAEEARLLGAFFPASGS